MKTRLDPEAAVDGVAEIAKRTSQLSHTLFDIAAGLIVDTNSDSSISQSICDIAREFADIAQLCMEACILLDQAKGHGKKTDAGIILGRLDMLVREFEDVLNDFVPRRVPRWLKGLFQNESVYLITKCHSIKEPLRLLLSVLRVAEVHRSSSKTSNKKKKKRDDLALTMAMECECAESWVETNRHVIKVLMDSERRLQKGFPRELLQLNHWTESPGATAAWIYDLIFSHVLSAEVDDPRLPRRAGRIRTVYTADGNGTASDSEVDDDLDSISPDLENQLDKSFVRSQVVDELLERWTGVNFQDVRKIADRNDRGRSRLQDTARRVIKWYWKNEKSSGDSSPSARNRIKTSRQNDDPTSSTAHNSRASAMDKAGDVTPMPVPTPPGSPKASTDQLTDPGQRGRRSGRNEEVIEGEDWGEDWGTIIGSTSRKRQKGKNVVGEEQVSAKDASKAFVFGESRMPSVAALQKQDAIASSSKHNDNTIQSPGATSSIMGQFGDELNPWAETQLEQGQDSKGVNTLVEDISELDLNTNTTRARTPMPVVSEVPSPDIVMPKPAESSSTKPIILRHGMKETQTVGGQEVRITVMPAGQQAAKRTALPKTSASDSNSRRSQSSTKRHTNHQTGSQVQFVEPEPDPERRSRDQRAPTRESSRNRNQEETGSRVSTRHGNQSTRHRSMNVIPEQPQSSSSMNSYNASALLPPGFLQPLPYASGSALFGHYVSPYTSYYPASIYESSGFVDERKSTDITELRNLLMETEKARRLEEDARREDGLLKAQRDEKLLTALKKREDELMKIIREMQENARSQEESWEDEKRRIEMKINAKVHANERTEAPTKTTDSQTSYYKEEVGRLCGIIERFNREKNLEWALERERIQEYANEELERRIEECEEQQQEALEEAREESRQYYEELIKAEQKKVQEAQIRAEVYVNKYNEEFTRRSRATEPSAMSGTTKVSRDRLNVFDFLEERERNSSLRSSSHELETVTETEEITTDSELYDNKWQREPYPQSVPQPRIRRFTAGSDTTSPPEEASNVIIFPPRAGWNDMGHNQLGNYLAMSGFTPYFEEREPGIQDSTGRREKIGTGGNVLRGTLFWQPPASTAEADLYKSLRSSGWRPTYVRTTVSGQTWFFGAQPVHAQFFSDMYKPQVGAYRVSHARPDTEKESLIISKDLVEIEELEFLGHIYKEMDGKIFLDPTLTSEDIDHIVARSFLAREGRYRKRFRNTQLRASQTKVDITELASDVGDSVSEISFGGSGREKTVSLWSLWSPWSR